MRATPNHCPPWWGLSIFSGVDLAEVEKPREVAQSNARRPGIRDWCGVHCLAKPLNSRVRTLSTTEKSTRHRERTMRSLLTILAAGALLALQGTANAAESEFQITPRAGVGDLRIDQFEGVDDNLADTDTYGLGVGVGFLTPIGIVFEAGADNFGDFDLFNTFDSFNLSQKFASVGYQFELGEGWRLVPRVGRAHWKLRSEEGRIFNPGPEEVRSISGDNYFWEASISRRISRVVTLGMNYRQGNFDFGRARTASFVVTFGF
jgi:hypothetical protein